MRNFAIAAGALLAASSASAQFTQCGGIEYNGATTCSAGLTCAYINDYWWNCIPTSMTTLLPLPPTGITAIPTGNPPSVSLPDAPSQTPRPPATGVTSMPSGPTGTTNYLVSFGDSYSQTGFDPDGTLANDQNPLGNPEFPGWTTSGGRNWIGYLLSAFNSSVLWNYNFADGGATTSAELIEPYEPTVQSFVDQVQLFRQGVSAHPYEAPWSSANTLFAVWMGVNDVGNGWYRDDWDGLVPQIMDVYFDQLDLMYDVGGRNFALLNVPPINRSPMMQEQGAASADSEADAITQYNAALSAAAAAWQSEHPGTNVVMVDTQRPFNTAMDDPSAYGAENASCYDEDGETCLWWNDYHPAMAIHRLVAGAVAEAYGGPFFTAE
ncbi:hypothetical protein BDY21DRAFT_386323 [Lineolata rhizophorae]|uniref:CBM1 domain-containing protein n=1 Tax=Lineolata rhizophorae TaxID=578093 RepID=A0A6A6NYT4_9PEZI|nr:hypothetical protein BDY21DRAFT_386323 [Lineolata rhizophorae]